MRDAPAKPLIVALAAFGLVVGACGSDNRTADTPSPATSSPPTRGGASSTPSPDTVVTTTPVDSTAGTAATEGSATMGNGPIDPGLKPYIDIAVADLATRLGTDANQIEVSSATLEQWPDSSLGCPQKGMQYAQVLTDGALIVLVVDGKTYKYHAGGSRSPFYCENSQATPSG